MLYAALIYVKTLSSSLLFSSQLLVFNWTSSCNGFLYHAILWVTNLDISRHRLIISHGNSNFGTECWFNLNLSLYFIFAPIIIVFERWSKVKEPIGIHLEYSQQHMIILKNLHLLVPKLPSFRVWFSSDAFVQILNFILPHYFNFLLVIF